MKKLLAKIRKILHDRRTRRFLTRFVSGIAAIVVFITTYALVLPAITMEKEANCGIEAHQHDDSCYTEELICDIPESEGHHHDEGCYSTKLNLICETAEHEHSEENGCYDEEGNLICELKEHHHGDECYEEVRELTCEIPESDGHQHTEECYEKVLSCGKEIHVHSTACYEEDPASDTAVAASTSSAAAATTSAGSVSSTGMTLLFEDKTEPAGDYETSVGNADTTDNDVVIDNDDVTDNGGTSVRDGSTETGSSSETNEETASAAEVTYGSENAGTGSTETANTALTGADNSSTASTSAKAADQYIPPLDAIDFSKVLNNHTGIYYYPVADGETVEDSYAIPAEEWKRIPNNIEHTEDMDDVELGSNDLLRVYLSYTIPAGSLNTTNPVARYRLPSNLHLTDPQVKAINENTNGIANQYIDMSTLEIKDPDKYNASLGLEAVEGTRRPDESVEDYLADQAKKTGADADDASEYISAIVRVENVYDTEGLYGEKDAYLGQDLIFTFTPYSIEKNQHEYDSSGQPTKAGKEIEGWITLDLNMGQVDFEEPEITTSKVETSDEKAENTQEHIATIEHAKRTAEIVFVEEGTDEKGNKIDQISTSLKLAEENVADAQDGDALENAADSSTNDKTEKSAGEDEKVSEAADQIIMPAMSFNDSIKVSTGRPAGIDKDAEGTLAEAAESLPEEAKVSVRVEADEGTFPAGTTMVLSAVDQSSIDALAETLAETVEKEDSSDTDTSGSKADDEKEESDNTEDKEKNQKEGQKNSNTKTYGFQAVDITFLDKDGNEIEPAKPVRVALTSALVEQAREKVEDSAIAAPVVVHVDNDGNAEQMDLVSPEEVEPAKGRNEEELIGEAEQPVESDKAGNADEGADAAPDNSTDNKDTAAVEENGENAGTTEFTADSFSVYAIVYTVELYTNVITDSGETYRISVTYDETSGIPQDAELKVKEIKEGDKGYKDYYTEAVKAASESSSDSTDAHNDVSINNKDGKRVDPDKTYARFFDIEIWANGEKIEPAGDVSMSIRLLDVPETDDGNVIKIVHFAKDDTEIIPYTTGKDDAESTDSAEDQNNRQTENDSNSAMEFNFTASSFSVYSVVSYTVDFHWEVNGRTYDFSIPGGGFVSLEHLVEVLGIARIGENTVNSSENKAIGSENASENDVYNGVEETGAEENDANTGSSYEDSISLNNVEVSEATKKFVADVASVEFSSPELVWVGKVDEETTVGGLKEANGLECEYSADLTDAQIAEINAQTVEAGDWALISVQPFDTEEYLAVTMANGDSFHIRVTDAKDPLGLDGRTFAIANLKEGNWYSLKAEKSGNNLKGDHVDHDEVAAGAQTTEYCSVEADAWLFKYDADKKAYYISCNGKYLSFGDNLDLVEDKNQVSPVTIEKDEDGNYLFSNGKGNYLIDVSTFTSRWIDGYTDHSSWPWKQVEGHYEYTYNGLFQSGTNGDAAKMRLCLPEAHGNSDPHKASLISAADMQPGQKIVIYQRVLQEDDTFVYYALNGNGQLEQVSQSSDAIYWRGDKTFEWTLTELGSGYYTLYNETTGKYLTPKSDGIVHTADFADFNGDSKHLSISLPGKDDGTYTSQIACWDYKANVTYGMEADDNGIAPKELLSSQYFYFASRDPIVHDQLTTVDTVDSVSKGITIKMYDWGDTDGSNSEHNSSGWDTYSNSYRDNAIQTRLLMMQDILGYGSDNYTTRGIEQGIAARTLEDSGFPNATYKGKGNKIHNLSELFADEYLTSANANHLFLQSVYDETGFYKYSSFENFAYIGNGDDFTVYEQIGTPSTRGCADPANGNYNTQNNPEDYKKVFIRGNFMPYNKIDSSMKYRFNEYDPDLNALSADDPRRGERLYFIENANSSWSPNPEASANYYFGMTMEAKFTQNPGGLSDHGDPMVFEFNGDDDMWIYIDNVLVLDIGGVHDAFRGRINFRTGRVEVYAAGNASINGEDEYTTIKEMYRKAHLYPDGTPWPEGTDEYVDEFFNGDTYKDYSTHNFKMIYMERGASASNLEMMFNMPILTRSEVRVTKDMPTTASGADIQSKYADAAFYYKAFVKENGEYVPYTRQYIKDKEAQLNKTLGTPVYLSEKTEKDPVVWKSDSLTEPIFEVEPGQTAVLPMVDDDVEYYVVEVEPESQSEMLEYFAVTNSDQDNSVNGDPGDPTIPGYQPHTYTDRYTRYLKTEEKTVYRRNTVRYQNLPDDSLVNELQIKKQLTGHMYKVNPEGPDDETNYIKATETDSPFFEYKIFLETTSGELRPYSLGEYYQTDKNGRYVFYQNGKRVTASMEIIGSGSEKRYRYTYYNDDGTVKETKEFEKMQITEHTSQNGSIGDIRDGDTIFIKGLLEGTDFLVWERIDRSHMSATTTDEDNKYTFVGTDVEGAYIRETGENKPSHVTGDLYKEATHVNGIDYGDNRAGTGTIIKGTNADDGNAVVTVKNRTKVDRTNITVKKNWEGDANGTEDVFKNSSIKVTLGRYILRKPEGTLLIKKTGLPTDISFDAEYKIYKKDDLTTSVNTVTYADLHGAGISVALAPGEYVVKEVINPDVTDERYTVTHGPSEFEVTVTDQGEAVAEFTVTNVKNNDGTLKISSAAYNEQNTELAGVLSDITYTVWDEEGNVARDTNNNLLDAVTVSDAAAGIKLLAGKYTVTENGTPANVSSGGKEYKLNRSEEPGEITITSGGTASAQFRHYYKTKGDPIRIRVRVYHDGNWQHHNNSDNYREVFDGTVDSDSTKASITLKAKPNAGIKYGVNGEATNSLTWSEGYTDGNNLNKTTFTVNLPSGSKDVIIWMSSSWGYDTNANFELVSLSGVSGNGPNNARRTMKAAPRKEVKSGTETYSADTDQLTKPGIPTGVPDGYEYQVDATFTTDNTVILNYGNWQKVIENLEASDPDGNKYYYYIKSVEETNMPKGVTLSIKQDDGKVFAVGEGKNEGKPLELTNTVTEEPETIDITFKKISSLTKTDLPGAIFQMKVKDGSSFRLVKAEDGIEGLSVVTENGTTYTAAFKTDGSTKTISKLKEGSYKLEEAWVPNGYIKKIGDIEFTVSEGKISGTDVPDILTFDEDQALITVVNEPGAALPNTGGPGTNLIYLLGLMLTGLAGAGLLMKRRRRNVA